MAAIAVSGSSVMLSCPRPSAPFRAILHRSGSEVIRKEHEIQFCSFGFLRRFGMEGNRSLDGRIDIGVPPSGCVVAKPAD